MILADTIDPIGYSRRLVVLFAALVAALGWAGVFDPDQVPVDTTSSDQVLPPLALAAVTVPDPVDEPADEDELDEEDGRDASSAVEDAEIPENADIDLGQFLGGGRDDASGGAAQLTTTTTEPAPVIEFAAAPAAPLTPDESVYEGEPVPDGIDALPADGDVSQASSAPQYVAADDAQPTNELLFLDDFNSVDDWRLYEQIVEARPDCYAEDLAGYGLGADGDAWLDLTANAGGAPLTNHPILSRLIDVDPVSGLHRLSVSTRIEEGSAANLQVGPEFSLQNTVQAESGRYLTQTFGVQYETRESQQHWNLWAAFGDDIGWRRITTAGIEEGVWYRITLVFDPATSEYHEFTVDGPGGFTLVFDEVRTLWQDKSFQGEAVWITLEAENLYTCDSPRVVTATVNYDSLRYERLG